VSSYYLYLRFFERFPSSTTVGGDTIFHGQDAASVGGNLVLVPGFGTGEFDYHSNGAIFLGRLGLAADFDIQRQDILFDYSYGQDFLDGGDTIYHGQDSSAHGGKLILKAGDATGTYPGGNIWIVTGAGTNNDLDNTGNIALGPAGIDPEYGLRTNFDLHITRPPITDASDAGDTFILGQIQTVGGAGSTGGHLIFSAGDGRLTGGNVILQPGEIYKSGVLSASTTQQGVIYVGLYQQPFDNLDLIISRDSTSQQLTAADTYIVGQSSYNAEGGSLHFVTGGSSTSNTGSNLFIRTGAGTGPAATQNGGEIIWDTVFDDTFFTTPGRSDDLYVLREVNYATGTSTTIIGQSGSNNNAGGTLTVNAGTGRTYGGNINLSGGNGAGDSGGFVQIATGAGAVGGAIAINAGSGSTNGGSITLWPGNGNPIYPGAALTFAAGTGSTANGNVQFGTTSGFQTIVNIPFVHNQQSAFESFNIGGQTLSISVFNPNGGFFTRGPFTMLKPRYKFDFFVHEPIIIPEESAELSVLEMRIMLIEILQGLVYHGLVSSP